MSDRKRLHMRVAVPADLVDEYKKAKTEAERVAGVVMSDSKFAANLIKWAIVKGRRKE